MGKKDTAPSIEEMEAQLAEQAAMLKQAKADARAQAKLEKNSVSIERTKGLIEKAYAELKYANEREAHWSAKADAEDAKLVTYAGRLFKLGVPLVDIIQLTGVHADVLVSDDSENEDEGDDQPELPIED